MLLLSDLIRRRRLAQHFYRLILHTVDSLQVWRLQAFLRRLWLWGNFCRAAPLELT